MASLGKTSASGKMSFRLFHVLCAAGLIPVFSLAAEAIPGGTESAWSLVEEFRFNEAGKAFGKAPESRETSFGEAVALLNAQPRSRGNLDRALAVFGKLAEENPADEIGALSRYYGGRIWQWHMETPDLEKAAGAYRTALDLGSGLPLVETAAASLVLMESRGSGKDGRAERLLALESLAEKLRSEIGRREFHSALGYAWLQLGEAGGEAALRKAVEHLREADRVKAARWQAEANLWIAIAEASRALDDRQTALRYYRKFLESSKRDRRNALVQGRVKELEEAGR